MKITVRICRETSGEFRAWCPSLPGCSARGTSQEHVMAQLERAIRGYLVSLNVVEPERLDPQMLEA